MPKLYEYEKILIDVEEEIYEKTWRISNIKFGQGKDWYIEKRRIHGGSSTELSIIKVY